MSQADLHLSGETQVRRGARTASRTVGGKVVVVVIDQRTIHTLNGVGGRVWQLADRRSLASIVDEIVTEFEVDRDTARGDVEHFVRELHAVGALEVYEDGR